jgi:dihydroorotate dehydrogenase electron transfer subunit
MSVHALQGPRYQPERLRGGKAAEDRGDTFEILFKVVGAGTRCLADRRPGDSLDLVGPLGRGFEIRPELERALLVAGGVGIAPMFFLAQELRARGKTTVAVVGAAAEDVFPLELRRDDDLLRVAPLEAIGVESVLVTERDQGLLVTEYLQAHLERLLEGGEAEIFACGPMGMLAEVARIAGEAIPCQVLLEERMCCGVGACRGCVTRVRDPEAPDGFGLRTVCGDGPVFRSTEIIWE